MTITPRRGATTGPRPVSCAGPRTAGATAGIAAGAQAGITAGITPRITPSAKAGIKAAAAAAAAAAALAAGVLAGCVSAPPATAARAAVPGVVAAAPAPACPGWAMADYQAAPAMRRLRVYTDPRTGDSAIEETPLPPKRTPLFKSGQILLEYNFGGPASKVQIVAGPANLDIAMKPTPYREAFVLLHGNVTLMLGDGSRRELGPGDMMVFEDVGARIGHGGRTGPCGYVSLNIVP